MQADEFEKKIQNKMEGFELVPDNEVWKQVAARIEKEKKKRRILICWLFPAFVLLSAAIGYWLINNENSTNAVTNNFDSNIDNSTKTENYKAKQDTNVFKHHFNKTKKIQAAKSIAFLKKAVTKHVRDVELKNNAFTKITNAEAVNKAINAKQEKAHKNIRYNENKSLKPLPLHRFYDPALTAVRNDNAFKSNNIDEKTNVQKAVVANTKAEKTKDKKTQLIKKWNVGFTIFSGISDNLAALSPGSGNTFQDNYPSNSAVNSGNYNYSANISKNFKSGFSFGLGIYVQKALTKRFSLSAGINYHLYTAKSAVGNKVVQQRSFYDSVFQNTTYVNSYYTISNDTKYSNKYQLAELPINLSFKLNKNHEKPLLLSAGFTPGYLVGSNALYANQAANVYYTDKQKFHRLQLFAQTGFSFPIIALQKYSIQAGPAVQYGFTNVSATVAGANQHLFFTGIKANITFK